MVAWFGKKYAQTSRALVSDVSGPTGVVSAAAEELAALAYG